MNSKVTLIILILYMASTQAASVGRTGMYLRCQCGGKTSSNFIKLKQVQDIKIFPSRPHCSNIEIIVTVEGKQVCLDPNEPWVKTIFDLKKLKFGKEKVESRTFKGLGHS